jgi:hypothetical protein
MNEQIEKQQLQSLINLYEEILKYYANGDNYEGHDPNILFDKGIKAEFALKQKETIINFNVEDNVKDLISVMEVDKDYSQEELFQLIYKLKNVK